MLVKHLSYLKNVQYMFIYNICILHSIHSLYYIKITYYIFGYILVHKYISSVTFSIQYSTYMLSSHIIYAFMMEMYPETNDTTTLCYKVYQICRISFIVCRNRLKTVSRLYIFLNDKMISDSG